MDEDVFYYAHYFRLKQTRPGISLVLSCQREQKNLMRKSNLWWKRKATSSIIFLLCPVVWGPHSRIIPRYLSTCLSQEFILPCPDISRYYYIRFSVQLRQIVSACPLQRQSSSQCVRQTTVLIFFTAHDAASPFLCYAHWVVGKF
jgi:hypothetical protein